MPKNISINIPLHFYIYMAYDYITRVDIGVLY